MSDFIRQQHTVNSFSSSDSWGILSPIEQRIKQKIEAVGVPLKEWDIQINYGIKTGCNEAFIINSDKRNEILANCKDEAERKRTEGLIRPILRGRDIKRYGYNWAGLWLINTHNGIKGRIPRIDINDYPAVKAHLDQYWDKISKRADKGDTPYNLRNCAYMEDFDRPKLVYAELARTGNAFCYDNQKLMLGNTGYILVTKDDNKDKLLHLLAFLNSRVLLYSLNQLCTRFDNNGWRWLRQFVEQLRVPPYTGSNELISTIETTNKRNQYINSEVINKFIYDKFNFSKEEQNYINDALKGY